MRDVATLLEAAERLRASGDEGVLVTLVHTKGSTYRRPGARMLVLPGCRTVGTISGGCLESAVARLAWEATRTVERAGIMFESAPEDDEWGPASGCHGLLYLVAERIAPCGDVPALEQSRRVRAQQRGEVCTHSVTLIADGTLAGDQAAESRGGWDREMAISLDNEASRWVERGAEAAFLEYLNPPTHLVICGAGDDAQPLVRLAAELAWTIDVADSRARHCTLERFPAASVVVGDPANLADRVHPHSAVVLMTHRFVDDLAALASLLAAPAISYIGVLGPRRRTERLLKELHQRGVTPSPRHLQALRSPVGLDLGAAAPETIALSIVAEIQAHTAARDARPLSIRAGAIHAAVPLIAEPLS